MTEQSLEQEPGLTGRRPGRLERMSRRGRLVLALIGIVAVVAAGSVTAVLLSSRTPDLVPVAQARLGPTPPAVVPPVTGPIVRVTPDGAGRGDTDSWADAASLQSLPDILRDAAPGTQVWLRADAGPYRLTAPLQLSGGGAAGRAVVVRGVDVAGAPRAAELVGDRADPYDPEGEKGKEVFRLLGGADHLIFQDLSFRNVGNGAFRVAGDINDLTIRQITATNVRRFIENHVSTPGGPTDSPAPPRSGAGEQTRTGQAPPRKAGTTGPTATVTGMLVQNVRVDGYSRAFARLSYDSNHITFDGVAGDSQAQDKDPFSQGIQLAGTVHDVEIRNAAMVNSVSTKGDYWNGDGFSAETDTYNIRYVDTYAAGNTDGGYDLKSNSAVLVNARAEDNKRNFRFWGNIEVQGCTGIDPHRRGGSGTQAQVHTTREARVTMTNCTFSDPSPDTVVFDADMSSTLTVRSSTVSHAPQARMSDVDTNARLDDAGIAVK